MCQSDLSAGYDAKLPPNNSGKHDGLTASLTSFITSQLISQFDTKEAKACNSLSLLGLGYTRVLGHQYLYIRVFIRIRVYMD